MKIYKVVIVREAFPEKSCARLPIMATNSWYIDVCNQAPIKSLQMHYQKLLTFDWCTMWKLGRECVPAFFAYKDSQYTHCV